MRLWSLHWKSRDLRPKRLENNTKKAEVLPLLGIGYDDIIGIVWLSSFYSWTSVQKSDNQFCVQNRFTFICVPCWCVECYKCLYCTFPKEDSPAWATLIFIKEKSELQRFVLDYEMSSLRNTLFISPRIHEKYQLRRNKRLFFFIFRYEYPRKIRSLLSI